MLTVSSEGRWPLKFVAQVASERYSYEPRSDYLFSLDTCPRIDIELSSNAAQRDSYRMLLQAGLLVRVVNKLTGRNSFVAIAIYITMEMTAEWYFVYQPALGDKKVAIPHSLIATMAANSFCRLNMSRMVFSSSRNPLAGSSSFTGSITSPPPFLMTGFPRLETTYLP